jgi:hypothetical protein
LDADDPAAWRELFEARLEYWSRHGGRMRGEVEALAYGDCLVEWHHRHGEGADEWRCAGCGKFFTNDDVLGLGHGVRVHFDPNLSCLTRYGQAWRSAAVAGLHALDIDPPAGFELL